MIVLKKLSGGKTLFSLVLMVSFTHCKEPVEPQQVVRSLLVEYKPLNCIDDILDIQDSLVPPVIYNGALNLDSLPVDVKKKKFIDMMLPSILYAKYNMEQIRARVEEIAGRMAMGMALTEEEDIFLTDQMTAYKASGIEELKEKLVTHPVSIVLAQAALESGWGTSRFFLEGNNVFGIWSYNPQENRIRANAGRQGRPVYLRKYDHISGSIQDYFNTIARSKAYRHFRAKRNQTDNVFEMIPFLNRYSEMGPQYVAMLKHMIKRNDLTRYDNYQLDPSYFVETVERNTLVAALR